jgi:hypothetical protein
VTRGQSTIATTHQKNRHGATSLATVAKGVCLRNDDYLTCQCPARPGR